MKILIRGAGDLATGIAARLYRCGHAVLMTEIPQPLTVRRTVAFSRAVCEGRARVEEMEAVLAGDYEEAQRILKQGDIPVLVDEAARVREQFRPDVLVDAVIAKRNLGTKITDAPLVVGVGPGFTAGEDCHCVVGDQAGAHPWQGDLGGLRHPQYRRAGQCGRLHEGASAARLCGRPDPPHGVHRRPGGEGADRGLHRERAGVCGHVRPGPGHAPGGGVCAGRHEDRGY